MLKKLILVIFMMPLLALGDFPVRVTFLPPTSTVNGATLNPETQISEYRMYHRLHGEEWAETYYTIAGFVSGSTTYETTRSAIVGDTRGWFGITLTAVTIGGLESDKSNEAIVDWRVDEEINLQRPKAIETWSIDDAVEGLESVEVFTMDDDYDDAFTVY